MQESSLKRICLISNYNLYESKRHFTLKLAEAMRRKGIETLHIDVKESALTAETLGTIARFNPNLTCSFNTLRPIGPDTFLWDYLQIPHWSILLDPVIYSMELTRGPYAMVSSIDLEDCEALQAQGMENSFFFPHAVERELIHTGEAEKPYDVVFLGSCYDYESLEALWIKEQPKAIHTLIQEASHLVLSDSSTSISKALQLASQHFPSPEKLDLPMLFYCIDRYTRGKDRVELIRSIKEAKVHVFGASAEDEITSAKGWDYYLANCKNVTLHPPVSFIEGLEILKKSKIALNSVPFFKKGSHERVFTSLSCGAVPLTTATDYWLENFRVGKEIETYSLGNNYQEVDAQINTLLADETRRQGIVAQGAAVVQNTHTWDQRVDTLLEILPPLLLLM